LQKELQNVVTNNVFWTKGKTQQQNNKIKHKKPLPEPGIEPGTSCTQSTAPPNQVKVSIVVKLFNCFDAIG